MAEVEVTRDGGVLTLTLNRPDVLNAINGAVHRGLAAGLKEARDAEVRAVVITGTGRGFCVGQDLREFDEHPGNTGDMLRATYHPNVLAIRALEKPVMTCECTISGLTASRISAKPLGGPYRYASQKWAAMDFHKGSRSRLSNR